MKKIIDINTPEDIRHFFLLNENYCSVDLPAYFDWQQVLNNAQEILKKENIDVGKAKQQETINYFLYTNKDGNFAWRKFEIIHPYMYVYIIDLIIKNWGKLQERFKNFAINDKIKCTSIPVYTDENKKGVGKQIENWYNNFEQETIKQAMKFRYMYQTDITDCYGSLYTHTIAWACVGKEGAKNTKTDKTLWYNKLDICFQAMHNGQTNGIPQGSVLSDFIAELVLGYCDKEASDKIKSKNINDYLILRYRDDIRVFTNSKEDGEKIIQILSMVLADCNFKLNQQKTFFSEDIIKDSIKEEKRYLIEHPCVEDTWQGRLMYVYNFSKQFQNCGIIRKLLQKFIEDFEKEGLEDNKVRFIEENNVEVLISIATQIAYDNPITIPVCCNIISKFTSLLEDKEKTKKIYEDIKKKFNNKPNDKLLYVWLQRISMKVFQDNFCENLCKCVRNKNCDGLFNNEWLEDKDILSTIPIHNQDKLDEMCKEPAKAEETQVFQEYKCI